MISGAEKALLAIMIFFIMMGMGATLSWKDIKEAIKTPKALVIGMLSQFILMPIIALALAKVLQLPNEFALGLILVGCTPGGTTSNLFTYYSRGDVALSISMTVASTIMAVIMMPILIWVFTTSLAAGNIQIPYANIIVTLLLILIPVFIGLRIRKKSEQAAKKVETMGSWLGIIVILFLIITWIPHNKELLSLTPWQVYTAAIMLGVFGYLFGYVMSMAANLRPMWRRTISLETGIQNTPLTIAIIILSFKDPLMSKILWLPIIYALFIVITSTIVAFSIFRPLSKKRVTVSS
jgi:BASS family bile acid:Na+ symporter